MKSGARVSATFGILAGAAFFLMRTGEYVAGGAPESLSINAFLFLVGLSVALLLLSPPPALRHATRHGGRRGNRARAWGGLTSAQYLLQMPRVINAGSSGHITVRMH
jgi:hypothetical protein